MKDLLMPAAVASAALLVIGLSVGAWHDTTVLVSPPEAVVEPFVRKLAAGRYDAAGQQLDSDSRTMRKRIRTTSDRLRARAGAISQVEGKAGAIDGDQATATAVITTARAGEIVMEFVLVRRTGSWRITAFQL